MTSHTKKYEGHFAMLLFSILIAGSNSLGKLIANDISPGALTAARFMIGAWVLGGLLIITGKFRSEHYRRPLRYLPLVASYAAFFVLMFYALKTTSPISTSALFTLMPLFSAILAWIFLGHASDKNVWMALTVGAAGALWIVFQGSLNRLLGLQLVQGDILFFIGLLAYSFYAVLIPKLTRGEPVYAITFAVLLGGAMVLSLMFWQDIVSTNWMDLPMRVLLVLTYLAIFAGICSMWLLTYASGYLPPAHVTAYTYLTPFWVIVMEPFTGRAMPSSVAIIGVVPITFALVFLLNKQK